MSHSSHSSLRPPSGVRRYCLLRTVGCRLMYFFLFCCAIVLFTVKVLSAMYYVLYGVWKRTGYWKRLGYCSFGVWEHGTWPIRFSLVSILYQCRRSLANPILHTLQLYSAVAVFPLPVLLLFSSWCRFSLSFHCTFCDIRAYHWSTICVSLWPHRAITVPYIDV